MAKKQPAAEGRDSGADTGRRGGAQPERAVRATLPDYTKMFETTRLSLASDFGKLLEPIKLPLASDYAKLLEPIKLSSDYAKLLEPMKLSLSTDYTKLLEPIKLWSDQAKLLEPTKLHAASDYFKLLEGSELLPRTLAGTSVSASFDEENKLREEINTLRKNVAEHAKALQAAAAGSGEREREIEQLRSTIEQLEEKARLGFLLERIHPEAQQQLRASGEFQAKFLASQECLAYVLSVDIRRSTELMLKARTAEKFAEFISGLAIELNEIVVDSLGVFDKFTGDGILAFFPDFFSGPDAAYRALAAAEKCHAAFARRYRESRTSFKTVLTEVGLGIGIDYGPVRLVQVARGLTVVGEPVVYACRLSSAPAGVTLVNQPAFEQISARFGGLCFAEERNHEIKHEGAMLAYEVRLNGKGHTPASPPWRAEVMASVDNTTE